MNETDQVNELADLIARPAKGARVVMSVAALQQRLDGRKKCRKGTVVGYGKESYLIRVLRDGHSQPETWHMKFSALAKRS
jgi:hypothetical protein